MKIQKLLILLFVAGAFVQKITAQITYCEPSFNLGCSGWSNKEITLDSIQWTLGLSDCAISDYTSMQTTLIKGVSTPMTVLNGSWCGVGVWIDYNTDGDFDPTENLYYQYTAGDPQTYSFLITIPTWVPDSTYRMRVIAGWGTDCYTVSANGYGACGIYEYGNFDDFTVNITSNVSIKENLTDLFAIYPNPASSNLILKISPELFNENFMIIDQLGKIIQEGQIMETSTAIQIENLQDGIYIICIGERSRKTFQVLKN